MRYTNTRTAKFISRPNRFIAHVEFDGKPVVCHVKNTGRCRELLVPGAGVVLEESDNPKRKTRYDLIGVWKGDRLINIDSQAPNRVFQQWAEEGKFLRGVSLIKPEQRYDASRLDFYMEAGERKILVEVKGVTLEEKGVVMFPDAPTQRGVKHVHELVRAVHQGYEAYIVFIIQMQDVLYFLPNYKTHREFGEVLKAAADQGVHILALDCEVTENTIRARDPVEVRLDPDLYCDL